MPEKEFEIYLSVLGKLLRLSPAQKAAISDEFRDHMEERLTTLLQSGIPREQAIQKAMEEFGDVTGLALDLTRVSRTPLRKVVIRSTVGVSAIAAMIVVWVTLFVPEHKVAAPLVVQAQQAKPAADKREERAAPEQKKYPAFPIPSAKVVKILQTLDEFTSVNFVDKPLEEAVDEIETQHGIQIWMNKQAMQDGGIYGDVPVTLTLKEIPLRSCLKLLLQPLGLVYVVEDEIMLITTAVSAFEKENSTRIYPVGDLFETPEEAIQLQKTIECGLGEFRSTDNGRHSAISSRMKTLTVRRPFVAQERVQTLLQALRDAQFNTAVPQSNRIARLEHFSPTMRIPLEPCDPPPRIRSFPLPTPRETRILSALDDVVLPMWKDKPLLAAMNEIKERCQFEIWIDVAALKATGLSSDIEVTWPLSDIPMRDCLALILEPLALVCIVEDDVMKITTATTLETLFETRIYPVGDLFATADEANQFLETIECGLGKPRNSGFLAVSSYMKTLTVRDTYVGQEKVRQLLCALRDAQQASVERKLDKSSDGGNAKKKE